MTTAQDIDTRVRLQIATVPATIRDVIELINKGVAVPDIYVQSGTLVHLTQSSGNADDGEDGDAGLPIKTVPLEPESLTRLLAQYAYVYKVVEKKGEEPSEVESAVSKMALEAALSEEYWPDVRALRGIVGTPTLRRNGTLLQTPGYDASSGLYYAPKVNMAALPDEPTAEQVAEAREFILTSLLGDFPFVDSADKANYIGMLLTPPLRPYLRCRIPFGLASATAPSSGKSLLIDILGRLYGWMPLVWPRGDDAELKKAITAALSARPVQVMVWDNAPEGTMISSSVLAQLLTQPTWSDRTLGSNNMFEAPNDREWWATGNNLRLGGDMVSRSVLVRLDPDMPHPEERDQSEFHIPELDQWLKVPANRELLLRHVLILLLDWINNDAPLADVNMRQFTPWAQAIGGLLAHHDIPGFLGNLAELRDSDDEDTEWTQFLARWHALFGDKPQPAHVLRKSADIEVEGNQFVDRWQGTFITDARGNLPTSKSLGRLLVGQVGRWHGKYVLRSPDLKIDNAKVYRVAVATND